MPVFESRIEDLEEWADRLAFFGVEILVEFSLSHVALAATGHRITNHCDYSRW